MGSSWPRNRTCVSRFSCITGGFFTYTAKSLQSCPILCNPIDGSPPGSPIPGILQEITLEWVAISLYNAWKWKWSRSVVSDSSGPHGLQPTRLLHPWDFPGKSTGVGCHCLLRLYHWPTRKTQECDLLFAYTFLLLVWEVFYSLDCRKSLIWFWHIPWCLSNQNFSMFLLGFSGKESERVDENVLFLFLLSLSHSF